MLVTKADGTIEKFDPAKLERSLRRSGADVAEATAVLTEVERRMQPNMTTRDIYTNAFQILKELGGPIATRYTLRNAILELGPTGFPFEDFMARLFQYQGYKTLVRQNLQGGCALHEIDVVGHKDDKSFIGEVKFHRDPGYKTDLQVALYSYARFLDLQDSKVCAEDICGINTLKIITNTKFTTALIEYSLCKGIELHSWGYPNGEESIEALVEKHRMYPITILSNLSAHQKMLLMQRGIVLCRDFIDRRSELLEYRLPEKAIEHAVAEAKALFGE
jgi:hypothetical protein